MILRQPFQISARLMPALRIGAAMLSVDPDGAGISSDNRDIARVYLDIPGAAEFCDENLKSGAGGFRSIVDIFESYLGFLSYAAESDDGAELFPARIVEWARENVDEIDLARADICDESGAPNLSLIGE